MSAESTPRSFAAIDLGSNSFHLIVAREQNGQLQIIDRIKEMVRLASGIDEQGYLQPEKIRQALDCLSRFGQRLSHIPAQNIRIVGTNTLRKAKNRDNFIDQAERTIGQEIEIIAGREEARLIYLGVAHAQSDTQCQRLVMDIGGGSTEFIIGRGFEPILTESLHMGCVSMTLKAFANGKLNEKNFHKAILAAEQELRAIRKNYLEQGWRCSSGASGTIKAVGNVLATQFQHTYRGITPEGLMWLKQAMITQKQIDNLSLPGLVAERAPVFAGGVAILIATFNLLQIDCMEVSDSALREGLIYDMLGRINHEDVRERTIEHLQKQYHVDLKQSRRVTETAKWLYKLCRPHWVAIHTDSVWQNVSWAARLHEIGMAIAHNQYHKHGAYIVEHADLPGFSKVEQKRLALLIRAQRRKLPLNELEKLNPHCYPMLIRQVIILRLAVIFNRGRSDKKMPHMRVQAEDRQLTLCLEKAFLDSHPLTLADLKQEKKYLKKINFDLSITSE